jgi:glycosyltransferase involved in cell wall biosynthesis
VLYICIPSYNEAPTVGVLLWRIRKVFQEYSREYEIIVYDDASTDGTRDALAPYRKVMPLTVIGGSSRVGYARAVEALLRSASERTKYPRRDAVVMMQADFTDQPEHLPELVKRFEGGADVVVGESVVGTAAPEPVRKLARLAKWMPALWPLRSAMSVPGVKDPFNGYRLMRISLIRDLLKARGDQPFVDGPVWSANIELLKAAAPLARRVESLPLASRWDVRLRESRVRPWPDAVEIIKRGWASRKHRTPAAVTTAAPSPSPNRTPTAAA